MKSKLRFVYPEDYAGYEKEFKETYNMDFEDFVALDEKKYKGKSLLEFPSDYTVIDLETTDLSYEYGEILEMAALKVRNGKIIDRYEQLVKPDDPIPPMATAVNGITDEMVADCPKLEDTMMEYLDFIGDDIVIGHNCVSFDVNYIYKNAFEIYGVWFSNNIVDTMRISRRLFKEEKHHRLKDLIKRYGLGDKQEHRGLSDCEYTKMVYDWMLNYIKSNNIDVGEWNKHNSHKKLNKKGLIATVSEFDVDNPFYQKEVVFTGALEKYLRSDAAQIVVNCGGSFSDNITKKTNYLVVADTGYREITNKMKKAEEYRVKGYDIETIPESLFYQILDDYMKE